MEKVFTIRGITARLILGDSETMDIEADALITDPPYGHGYIASAGGVMTGKKWHGGGKWKRAGADKIIGYDKPFDPSRWLKYPIIVMWGANHYASKLPDSAAWFVWDKRDGTGDNNMSDCELAWCNRGGSARLKRHLWNGLCRDSEIGEHMHPTQKPVVIMAWVMDKAKVAVGATVLDPYMGSGTTGVACLGPDGTSSASKRPSAISIPRAIASSARSTAPCYERTNTKNDEAIAAFDPQARTTQAEDEARGDDQADGKFLAGKPQKTTTTKPPLK